jgi:hypothetical protein
MTYRTIELFDPQIAASHAPELPDPSCTHPAVQQAWRERCIREAAYYRSLRRPGAAGTEVEDWLAAEREVDDNRAK